LDLRNFGNLLQRNFADFVAVRLRRTLGDARGAEQQNRGRRRLQNESEAAVGVNGDEDRENHSVRLFAGLGVELFAEIHNVEAMRTERSADRRSRSGFARWQLQLDGRLYFLWRHVSFT